METLNCLGKHLATWLTFYRCECYIELKHHNLVLYTVASHTHILTSSCLYNKKCITVCFILFWSGISTYIYRELIMFFAHYFPQFQHILLVITFNITVKREHSRLRVYTSNPCDNALDLLCICFGNAWLNNTSYIK